MQEHNVDYLVHGPGMSTVYLVSPQNPRAHKNLTDNVGEDAQWMGNSLAVEHRYIGPLAEQLVLDGWTVKGAPMSEMEAYRTWPARAKAARERAEQGVQHA